MNTDNDYIPAQDSLYDDANFIRNAHNSVIEHVRDLARHCNLSNAETQDALEAIDDMLNDMLHKRWTELELAGLTYYGDRDVGVRPSIIQERLTRERAAK